jgi:hypothetical protein
MSYGQLKPSDHPPILSFFRFLANRRRDRKDEMMANTDLMSVGANPLQNTRIPSALTALLAAVTMDIRPGTLPVESGCTDWIRVLRTSSGKVACEEVARLCHVCGKMVWFQSAKGLLYII